jgi:hypothetical protein
MGVVLTARRRWLFLAVALASVLVASAGYLAPATERRAAAMPVPQVTVPAAPDPLAAAADPGPAVRYGFEGEGHLPLVVQSASGGAVGTETHDGGLAVRFPPPCPQYGDPTCPRAILETSFASNPGTGPLRYGATVQLTASETSSGENVLQKGFSHGHSQFKLQVDGAGGQPSCVLVGTSSPQIYVVTANVSVADGQWHTVECVRTGGSLTVFVDGADSGQAGIPAELSIVNNDPLRIGGKGISPNNDQFHGALDDVFVSIGS